MRELELGNVWQAYSPSDVPHEKRGAKRRTEYGVVSSQLVPVFSVSGSLITYGNVRVAARVGSGEANELHAIERPRSETGESWLPEGTAPEALAPDAVLEAAVIHIGEGLHSGHFASDIETGFTTLRVPISSAQIAVVKLGDLVHQLSPAYDGGQGRVAVSDRPRNTVRVPEAVAATLVDVCDQPHIVAVKKPERRTQGWVLVMMLPAEHPNSALCSDVVACTILPHHDAVAALVYMDWAGYRPTLKPHSSRCAKDLVGVVVVDLGVTPQEVDGRLTAVPPVALHRDVAPTADDGSHLWGAVKPAVPAVVPSEPVVPLNHVVAHNWSITVGARCEIGGYAEHNVVRVNDILESKTIIMAS
mmetsp:Transcript_18719/g.38306  ORF Transcript_18719/g.38306 Transcript_18719/m.38306 type:complete len:360 (+) Transcript_18719:5009-6088(+)